MRLKIRKGNMLMSLIAVSALVLAGCSTTDVKAMVTQGSAVSAERIHLTATNPSRVKIYYSNAGLPKHYKVIGRVSAENYNMVGIEHSQESIAELLKKQAASIGATGVINLSTGLTQTTGDAIIVK